MFNQQLTDNSVKDYIHKVNYLSKIFLSKPLTSMMKEQLNLIFRIREDDFNIKDELEFINWSNEDLILKLKDKYKNKKTLIAYLNTLFILKRNLGVDTELLKEEIAKIGLEISQERELNLQMSDNLITFDNIDDNLNKLTDLKEKLIYALYMLIPARRLEYRYLTFLDGDCEECDNKDINWIYIKDKKIKFIFNEYKTKYKYKRQSFNFENDKLIDILKEYINKYQIKGNDLLFKSNKGTLMTYTQFGKLTTTIFSKIYNKKITVNDIRHSWANKVNEDIPKMTLREIMEITNFMGHSVLENLKYRRISQN